MVKSKDTRQPLEELRVPDSFVAPAVGSPEAAASEEEAAPIPPEPSISKSGPRDLEFEYPVVVFKIERARYKIDTRGESSTTEGCSRRGFALASR